MGIVGYGVTGTAAQHWQDNSLRTGQCGNIRFGKRPALKTDFFKFPFHEHLSCSTLGTELQFTTSKRAGLMNLFKGAGLIKTCLKELAGQNLFLLITGLVRNNAPAVFF